MTHYHFDLKSTGTSQNGTSYNTHILLPPENTGGDHGQAAKSFVPVGIIHEYHDHVAWLVPRYDLFKIPPEEHDSVKQQAEKERDKQYAARYANA